MLAPTLLPAAAPRCAAARRIRTSAASCAVPCAPVAAAPRSSSSARRLSLWRCASSAADNVASGPVGAAQPLQPPPVAAAELPALAELSKVRWYECLAGVTYLVLMSEVRVRPPRPRRCTEKARARNPRPRRSAHPCASAQVLRFVVEGTAVLSEKLFAGALLALLLDFLLMAWNQMRGSRSAKAAGRPIGTFRPLLALKIVAELAGTALIVARGTGAAGALVALGGHFVFNVLNSVSVSSEGAVRAVRGKSRTPLIVADAVLTAFCAVGTLAPGQTAGTCAGGVFAAFAAIYCFYKFVLGKKV